MELGMTERLFFVVSSAAEALAEHLARTSSSGSGSAFSTPTTMTPTPKMSKNGIVPTAPNTSLPGSSASQLSPELMERLLTASSHFPVFTSHQRLAIQRAAERKPRYSEVLAYEPKPVKHLRRSSIDRILEELDTASEMGRGRTEEMNKLFKSAFDQIMLSANNDN